MHRRAGAAHLRVSPETFELAESMGLMHCADEIEDLVAVVERHVIEEGTTLNAALIESIVESSIAGTQYNDHDPDLADLSSIAAGEVELRTLRNGIPLLSHFIRSRVGVRGFVEELSEPKGGSAAAGNNYSEQELVNHRMGCCTRLLSVPWAGVVVGSLAVVAAVAELVVFKGVAINSALDIVALARDTQEDFQNGVDGTVLGVAANALAITAFSLVLVCTPLNHCLCGGRLMTRPADGSRPQPVGAGGLLCRILGNTVLLGCMDDATACCSRLSICDLVCGQQVLIRGLD